MAGTGKLAGCGEALAGGFYFLRCRIRLRIRRFLRPTLRRPLPRRRLAIHSPQGSRIHLYTHDADGIFMNPRGGKPLPIPDRPPTLKPTPVQPRANFLFKSAGLFARKPSKRPAQSLAGAIRVPLLDELKQGRSCAPFPYPSCFRSSASDFRKPWGHESNLVLGIEDWPTNQQPGTKSDPAPRSSGRTIISKCEILQRKPSCNLSRPAEPGQQPGGEFCVGAGDGHCES